MAGALDGIRATPTRVTRLAPPLGRDSRELLLEAGWAADEVEQLLADGVVYQPD